jgi:hypothetical protein
MIWNCYRKVCDITYLENDSGLQPAATYQTGWSSINTLDLYLELLGSNLSYDNNYPDKALSDFLQFLHANAGIVP